MILFFSVFFSLLFSTGKLRSTCFEITLITACSIHVFILKSSIWTRSQFCCVLRFNICLCLRGEQHGQHRPTAGQSIHIFRTFTSRLLLLLNTISWRAWETTSRALFYFPKISVAATDFVVSPNWFTVNFKPLFSSCSATLGRNHSGNSNFGNISLVNSSVGSGTWRTPPRANLHHNPREHDRHGVKPVLWDRSSHR